MSWEISEEVLRTYCAGLFHDLGKVWAQVQGRGTEPSRFDCETPDQHQVRFYDCESCKRRYRYAHAAMSGTLARETLPGFRGLAEAAAQRFGRRATRPDERPPLAPIRPADLVEALRRALAPAGGMRRVLVRIQRERIRLEDRIRTVWETIAAATELVPFRRLLGPRPSRAAIVVTFLAVLELVRDRRVTAWQAEPLGEIYLGRADSPPEAAAAGEVDGDRPPVL